METKRITVIQKNPNVLFKRWLREWIEEAEKKRKNAGKTYERALESLIKYPLTLYSGHDCAILENFGPKICQMLDAKLKKHLVERLDLYKQTSHKAKIAELQRRDNIKLNELIRSVEAACCTDISVAQASLHDTLDDDMEDIAAQVTAHRRQTIDESFEQEDDPADVEIPEELLSSSADTEDSLDLLVRKYDPEAAEKKKKLKRVKTVDSSDLIRRHMKTFTQAKSLEADTIDLTEPFAGPTVGDSPKSSFRNGAKLKKFKSFDTRSNLAGPSYASSPIATCFDAQPNFVQASPCHDEEDEFDRLAAKYDFASPITASPVKPVCAKPAAKLTKKASSSKLPAIPELTTQRLASTQSIPEDEDDELKYISIDDINPSDYNVVLLVDIQETSGLVWFQIFLLA